MATATGLSRNAGAGRFTLCDLGDADGSLCVFDHHTLDSHHLSAVEAEVLILQCEASADPTVKSVSAEELAQQLEFDEGTPKESAVAAVRHALGRLRQRGLLTTETS